MQEYSNTVTPVSPPISSPRHTHAHVYGQSYRATEKAKGRFRREGGRDSARAHERERERESGREERKNTMRLHDRASVCKDTSFIKDTSMKLVSRARHLARVTSKTSRSCHERYISLVSLASSARQQQKSKSKRLSTSK